ncbi:MAG: 5'-3' exonuclease H3TH domain-containing protein [Acidobacteriota bacterium]|nr:5'-3' exonuclease H3TH domain-containing protein [Acidobacteriota bacterium]
MNVFLIDGTYELFRHFYAVPSATDAEGREVGAVRGVVGSVLGMLEEDVTHLGVATDHVIESFRNELWPGYKTGEGIEPALFTQFSLLEEALVALGVRVWPMTEFEADDGLASAALAASADARVEQVFICTPDKDLAQCVVGRRVVQFDRRAGVMRDADGVRGKFGVLPESIPDYLALVGDAADGFPGLRGWGAKSTALVLARYGHLEAIPDPPDRWDVKVRGAVRLATELATHRDLAVQFRDLATLRTTVELFESVDTLRWSGPRPTFFDLCARLNAPGYFRRARQLADSRAS